MGLVHLLAFVGGNEGVEVSCAKVLVGGGDDEIVPQLQAATDVDSRETHLILRARDARLK